ncbi:hypothetical protein C8J56DRAFT_1049982 [Mycena floridula]|nr:hypothetical protein C8J56DRAFT_1049982 [Mycena floridula]
MASEPLSHPPICTVDGLRPVPNVPFPVDESQIEADTFETYQSDDDNELQSSSPSKALESSQYEGEFNDITPEELQSCDDLVESISAVAAANTTPSQPPANPKAVGPHSLRSKLIPSGKYPDDFANISRFREARTSSSQGLVAPLVTDRTSPSKKSPPAPPAALDPMAYLESCTPEQKTAFFAFVAEQQAAAQQQQLAQQLQLQQLFQQQIMFGQLPPPSFTKKEIKKTGDEGHGVEQQVSPPLPESSEPRRRLSPPVSASGAATAPKDVSEISSTGRDPSPGPTPASPRISTRASELSATPLVVPEKPPSSETISTTTLNSSEDQRSSSARRPFSGLSQAFSTSHRPGAVKSPAVEEQISSTGLFSHETKPSNLSPKVGDSISASFVPDSASVVQPTHGNNKQVAASSPTVNFVDSLFKQPDGYKKLPATSSITNLVDSIFRSTDGNKKVSASALVSGMSSTDLETDLGLLTQKELIRRSYAVINRQFRTLAVSLGLSTNDAVERYAASVLKIKRGGNLWNVYERYVQEFWEIEMARLEGSPLAFTGSAPEEMSQAQVGKAWEIFKETVPDHKDFLDTWCNLQDTTVSITPQARNRHFTKFTDDIKNTLNRAQVLHGYDSFFMSAGNMVNGDGSLAEVHSTSLATGFVERMGFDDHNIIGVYKAHVYDARANELVKKIRKSRGDLDIEDVPIAPAQSKADKDQTLMQAVIDRICLAARDADFVFPSGNFNWKKIMEFLAKAGFMLINYPADAQLPHLSAGKGMSGVPTKSRQMILAALCALTGKMRFVRYPSAELLSGNLEVIRCAPTAPDMPPKRVFINRTIVDDTLAPVSKPIQVIKFKPESVDSMPPVRTRARSAAPTQNDKPATPEPTTLTYSLEDSSDSDESGEDDKDRAFSPAKDKPVLKSALKAPKTVKKSAKTAGGKSKKEKEKQSEKVVKSKTKMASTTTAEPSKRPMPKPAKRALEEDVDSDTSYSPSKKRARFAISADAASAASPATIAAPTPAPPGLDMAAMAKAYMALLAAPAALPLPPPNFDFAAAQKLYMEALQNSMAMTHGQPFPMFSFPFNPATSNLGEGNGARGPNGNGS